MAVRDAGVPTGEKSGSWSVPRSSWVAALCLLLVIAAALVAAYRLGPKHLLTVEPGVLYRSGQVEAEQLGRLVDRLGVRTVVNLRSAPENETGNWYAEQRAVLGERGVEMLDIPMHTGWPPTPEQVGTWVALMQDPERQPVLVHCEYGVVRTGMMVSIYQIDVLGRDPNEVWADFEHFGGAMREPVLSRVGDFVRGDRPLTQSTP